MGFGVRFQTEEEMFLFSTSSKMVLGPKQPPNKCGRRASSPGAKGQRNEAEPTCATYDKVKNACSYNFISLKSFKTR